MILGESNCLAIIFPLFSLSLERFIWETKEERRNDKVTRFKIQIILAGTFKLTLITQLTYS